MKSNGVVCPNCDVVNIPIPYLAVERGGTRMIRQHQCTKCGHFWQL